MIDEGSIEPLGAPPRLVTGLSIVQGVVAIRCSFAHACWALTPDQWLGNWWRIITFTRQEARAHVLFPSPASVYEGISFLDDQRHVIVAVC